MAVMVSQAAGCIITSGDDTADYAIIGAAWSTENVAGQQLQCPSGATTAAVYAQAVDTSYHLVGQPFIDLYDCSAFAGNSDPLPPDVYQVWVELTSGSGGTVFATSTSVNENTSNFEQFVNVLDVDQTFKTTILQDGGYFQFDWDLRNAAGAPITCNGVAKVGLLSTSVTNANNSFDDRFNCERTMLQGPIAISGGLLQGAYTIEVSATNAAGQGIGPNTEILNKQIQSPNKVTDLGTVMVRVD